MSSAVATSVATQLQQVQKSPNETPESQAQVLEQGYAGYAKAKTGNTSFNPQMWTQYVHDVSNALMALGAQALEPVVSNEGEQEAQQQSEETHGGDEGGSQGGGVDSYRGGAWSNYGTQLPSRGGGIDPGVIDAEEGRLHARAAQAASQGPAAAGDLLPPGTTLKFPDNSSYVVRPGQKINKNDLPKGTTWVLPIKGKAQ